MHKVVYQTFILSLLIFLCFPELYGQPVLPSDLKKPKKYENRKLGAEKSAEKKFKGPRKFIQNTVTHYNWYFNANNKLNEILERAKLAHKEDYSKLLPFYNYTLERTSGDKTELDSVIYKANTGILTHDLRNSWIDNLYMLMGKAYYFRNELDSAYLTFQYINYAFSPKEPDGYDMPIGSNANEGTNALSVSTKEKNTVVKRALTTPPSRNESFIWQIRTYIGRNQMIEAASLIETLRNDPVFPERLSTDLSEVQALWFYENKRYDSAAAYLEKALDNSTNRQETSRWLYLIGQLHELSNNRVKAGEFFERAKKTTLDPVLEVYSILNAIRQNNTDSTAIKKNIEELHKMGRKDRYSKYRDIVYYTAAQIELERNNIAGAKEMLRKSAAASTENLNPIQRTKSFLLLGDLSFKEKNYSDAKRYYDSVNTNDPGLEDPVAFEERRINLQQIVAELEVISRQDSLQRLAAMPEAERNALLRKMTRQLRRKYGLKEEATQPGNAAVGMGDANKPAPDLFGANNNNKGDWYFANPALKSKGFTTFKQAWGNRPNVDNWRRQSAVEQGPINPSNASSDMEALAPGEADSIAAAGITVESLLKSIPLTPEQMELSEDSVSNAMANLGILYVDKLEEYDVAIDVLEKFVEKYNYSARMGDVLFYLHYAYKKTGKDQLAAKIKTELDTKFAGTRYQQLLHNAETGDEDRHKTEVTRAYENIYNLFIEGNFSEAVAQKKMSDSIYGSVYWTPQLLYIESVYYLQSRMDDQARLSLNNIIELYPDQPMAEKAKNILEVLGRRKEIEDYLTQLEIKRVEDTITAVTSRLPAPGEKIGTPMQQDSTTLRPVNLNNIDSNTTGRKPEAALADSSVAANNLQNRVEPQEEDLPSTFSFTPDSHHAIVILLTKVDPVYVTESRNAFNRYNSQSFYNQPIEITNQVLNDSMRLVVMTGFENSAAAINYMKKTEPIAATQIVPWLPAGKYSFMVISLENLGVLKNNQDLEGYRKFYGRYPK